MKTIEHFFAEAKDNKELWQAFQEALKNGTADAFLKEQQVDTTLEELKAFAKKRNGELTDEELDNVAGGYCEYYDNINFNNNCPPRFEYGQRVKYKIYPDLYDLDGNLILQGAYFYGIIEGYYEINGLYYYNLGESQYGNVPECDLEEA